MEQFSQVGMGKTYDRKNCIPASGSLPHGPWVALDSRTLKALEPSKGKHHGVAMQGQRSGTLSKVETATDENQLAVEMSSYHEKSSTYLKKKISSVSFSHGVEETTLWCLSAESFCFAFKRKGVEHQSENNTWSIRFAFH